MSLRTEEEQRNPFCQIRARRPRVCCFTRPFLLMIRQFLFQDISRASLVCCYEKISKLKLHFILFQTEWIKFINVSTLEYVKTVQHLLIVHNGKLDFIWLAKKVNFMLTSSRLLVSIWMLNMSMEWLLLIWLYIVQSRKLVKMHVRFLDTYSRVYNIWYFS